MGAKTKSKQGNVLSESGKRGRSKSSQRDTRSSSMSSTSSNASEESDQFELTYNQRKFTEKTENRMTRSQRQQSCIPQVSDTVVDVNSTSTHSSETTELTPTTSANTLSLVQSNDNATTALASFSETAIPSGEDTPRRGRGRPRKPRTEVQIEKVQPSKVEKKKEQQPGPSSSGTSEVVEKKGHLNWLRVRDKVTGKFVSNAQIKRRERMKAKIKQGTLKSKEKSGSSGASDLKDVAGKSNSRGTHAAKCKKKNLNVTLKRNELKKTNETGLNRALSKSVINGAKRNQSESEGRDSDDELHPKSTTRARSQKKQTEEKKTPAPSSSRSLRDVSDYDTDNERNSKSKKGNKMKRQTIKDEPMTESEEDVMDSERSDSDYDAQICTNQGQANRKKIPKATIKSKRSNRMKEAKKKNITSSASELSSSESDDSEDDADMLTDRRAAVKKEMIEDDPAYSPSELSSEDTSDNEKMDVDDSDVEILEVVKKQPKNVKKPENRRTLKRVRAISESENKEDRKEDGSGDESENPKVENPRRSQRIQKKAEPTPRPAPTDVSSLRRSNRPIKRVSYADMDDSDIEYISSFEILTVTDNVAKTLAQRKRKTRGSPSASSNSKKGILGKVKQEPLNDEESIPRGDGVNEPINQAVNPGPSCSNIDNPSSSNSMSVRNDATKEPLQQKRKTSASPCGNPDSKKGNQGKVKGEPLDKIYRQVDIKTEMKAPIPRNVAPTSTAEEISMVSNHRIDSPANIATEVEAPIPRNVASTLTAEESFMVPQPIHRQVNIETEMEAPIPKSLASTSTSEENTIVPQPIHKQVNIKTELEAPVPRNVASTSNAEEKSMVPQPIDRQVNIKTEMEAPIPRNIASTSTAKEVSIVSNHQIHRPANIATEVEAPIPRTLASTLTAEANSMVPQPVQRQVHIKTEMEAPNPKNVVISRNVASTLIAEENSMVPQPIQRQVNIKTEMEAPIPRHFASTLTEEESSLVTNHQIHRPANIKTKIEASITRNVVTTMKVEREDCMVSQQMHRQVNIKTEIEDVEFGIKTKPRIQKQNQSRPAMPQTKNVEMHPRYSNSTTPQTSGFSSSVSPDVNVNAVRDVSTTTSHHLMTSLHFPSSSQSYGTSYHSSVEPVETYWRPDQNNSTVPQASTAHEIPMFGLEAEPEYPNNGANNAMFHFNNSPSTSATQFAPTNLFSGINNATTFSFPAFDLGSSLQNSGQFAGQYVQLPYPPSTLETCNILQSIWPQYPYNNTGQYAASALPFTAPEHYNHVYSSSPSTSSQPYARNQPTSTTFECSKDIYKNVPMVGKKCPLKKEAGVSPYEASVIFKKYLAENQNHQRRKMKFLQSETGWSKYHINKWFAENQEIVVASKLLNPATQHALEALFHQKQFFTKEVAKAHEQHIGIPADKIYRWMFDRRVKAFNLHTRSGMEKLPSQMKILEKVYKEKKYIHFHNAKHLIDLTGASFRQIAGYFKARRQYERSNGSHVVEIRNMEEEKQEEMAGYELVFQDSYWEFGISECYLNRYSFESTNLQRGSRELVESRIKARGPMFEHVPLPFNHSTDFKKWTHPQFLEFATQFLPHKPVNCLRELQVSGSQAGRFLRSDQELFSALKDADSDGNSFTEEAFNSIGTKLQSIIEAEKQWMTAFNARRKQ